MKLVELLVEVFINIREDVIFNFDVGFLLDLIDFIFGVGELEVLRVDGIILLLLLCKIFWRFDGVGYIEVVCLCWLILFIEGELVFVLRVLYEVSFGFDVIDFLGLVIYFFKVCIGIRFEIFSFEVEFF